MKRFLKEMCVLEIASGLSKIAQDIVLLDDYISLDCYPFFQNASPPPSGCGENIYRQLAGTLLENLCTRGIDPLM